MLRALDRDGHDERKHLARPAETAAEGRRLPTARLTTMRRHASTLKIAVKPRVNRG
jgi:hypothetical protein